MDMRIEVLHVDLLKYFCHYELFLIYSGCYGGHFVFRPVSLIFPGPILGNFMSSESGPVKEQKCTEKPLRTIILLFKWSFYRTTEAAT